MAHFTGVVACLGVGISKSVFCMHVRLESILKAGEGNGDCTMYKKKKGGANVMALRVTFCCRCC
eukprot:729302-Pelagomonas_calceolata.AAC.5